MNEFCGMVDSDMMSCLVEVYASWMSDALSRFNSDLFYQPREYIAECYRAGYVIEYEGQSLLIQ